MRFTLISPRIAVQKGDFLGSGVPYWPVEMAVLASFLKQRNHNIRVIDLFGSSPQTLEESGDHFLQGRSLWLHSEFKKLDSDLIIIFALSYMSHQEILRILSYIQKVRPQTRIAVLENSQAVTAYDVSMKADEFFSAGATFVFCGEVYWNWDEIVGFIDKPESACRPGNVLWSGERKPSQVNRQYSKVPSYPIPAWELFPLTNYWKLPYSHGPKWKKYLPMLTARGCPYPCDFCVVPQTNNVRWRGRPAGDVVDEMINLKERFGVDYFQVEDLNPTVQSTRWEEIAHLLLNKKAGIYFGFVSGTKAETLKLNQLDLLARAGCRYISISPESGSAAVLKAIGKPFDYHHGLALIKRCRELGIYTQACLLVGHPAELPEDHQKSCDYLRAMVRAGLDEVAVFIVSPLAGSVLYAKQRIALSQKDALISFSPKGRENWQILSDRRRELIRIFFWQKIHRDLRIWLQGLRSVFGRPKTKMENLPRRIFFIYKLILQYKIQTFFGSNRRPSKLPDETLNSKRLTKALS
jgi:anaerobic magnesium-protoporphyrin IX monomethyl ester cyclase